MAIQIRCFYCDKQFLMHSANTKCDQIELDWKKVEIECPHCGACNREFLQPIKPQASGLMVVDEQPDSDEEQANQQVFDFYQDYLPGTISTNKPRYVTSEELMLNSQPSTAFEDAQREVLAETNGDLTLNEAPLGDFQETLIFDESGGVVASVSGFSAKVESNFDDDHDPFAGITKT